MNGVTSKCQIVLPPWTEVVEIAKLPNGMQYEPCVVVETAEDVGTGVERVVTANRKEKAWFRLINLNQHELTKLDVAFGVVKPEHVEIHRIRKVCAARKTKN